MTEPTHRPRPTTYAKHPPEVWEAIRADYMAGQTVAWCAERHGVGYAIIDWRSRKHGWRAERAAANSARYAAAAEAARQVAAARVAEPAPAQPQTPEEAARAAFAQSAQTLAEGRPAEAQSWARLAKSMSGMRLPGAEGGSDGAEDPDRADEPWSDPAQRPFRPGFATAFDNLTMIAEKRLDMLFRDFWTGGQWDDRYNKPSYCMDRDGRIVRTWEVPDSWFDGFADDAERREWMNTPLPPCSTIPPPPLAWIFNVWMPHWNEHHPDDQVTEAHAAMIHQIYTRDPRLEWGYTDPQVQLARIKWETEQLEKGLPLPVIKAPWTDNDERRAREREAEDLRRRELAAMREREGPRSEKR